MPAAVGNLAGEGAFMDQKECLAANPKIYGHLVPILGKYSKFVSAGEKAALGQTLKVPASFDGANPAAS